MTQGRIGGGNGAATGGQGGIILVVVLWSLALMTVVVVAISALAQRSIDLSAVETDRLRSEWALSAGVEAGKALIMGIGEEDRLLLDGREMTLDIGGGRRVRLSIRDGAGLVDVNRADGKLLQAVFQMAGLGDAGAPIVEGLANLKKKAEEAAKSRQTSSLPRAESDGEPATSAGLVSPIQLYGLPGVAGGTLGGLMPLIGLYSSDGKVNPLAAPAPVLAAIPGIEPAELGVIQVAKETRNLKGGIATVVQHHADFLALNEPKSFVIAVTTGADPGLLADFRLQTVVILEAEGPPPKFHTLALSW